MCRFRPGAPINQSLDIGAVNLVYFVVTFWFFVKPKVSGMYGLRVHFGKYFSPEVFHPVTVQIHIPKLALRFKINDARHDRIVAGVAP
jgi:esterase/lipase superfamily enzyme